MCPEWLRPVCDFASWYIPATILDAILESKWVRTWLAMAGAFLIGRVWAQVKQSSPKTKHYLFNVACLCVAVAAAGGAYLIVVANQAQTSASTKTAVSSPDQSIYSGMSNATLRQITTTHVKVIEAMVERTNDAAEKSEELFARSDSASKLQLQEAHEMSVQARFRDELSIYKNQFMPKSLNLRHELLRREPDYTDEIDPIELQSLDREYLAPIIPQDIQAVATDLETMAQRLPP